MVVYRVQYEPEKVEPLHKIFATLQTNIGSAIATLESSEPDLLGSWPKEVDTIDLTWSVHSPHFVASVHIDVKRSIDGRMIAWGGHSIHAPELRGEVNPYVAILRSLAVQIPNAYRQWLQLNKQRRKHFSIVALRLD